MKIQKIIWGSRVGGGSGLGCRVGGGQDGCERNIEFFVKIKKKKGGGCQVGGGGSGFGVRVDRCNREVKFL